MKTFKQFFAEQASTKSVDEVLELFKPFVQRELDIHELPPIKIVKGEDAQQMKAFGCWDGECVTLCPDGRHPMDVMRTLAHELVHASHGHTNGEDGSDDENEANSKAGVIMRRFAREYPHLF
jgi:hypothetical protein